MNLIIISVGSVKNPSLKDLESDYITRIKPLNSISQIIIADGKNSDAQKRLAEERDKILEKIPASSHVIVLDEKGNSKTSLDLSKWIEQLQNAGTKNLVFLIGSSHGLHEDFKTGTYSKLQLSAMTLTHEFCRVLLLEQVYRSYMILKNLKYHH